MNACVADVMTRYAVAVGPDASFQDMTARLSRSAPFPWWTHPGGDPADLGRGRVIDVLSRLDEQAAGDASVLTSPPASPG
jgi:hypothetical protein